MLNSKHWVFESNVSIPFQLRIAPTENSKWKRLSTTSRKHAYIILTP